MKAFAILSLVVGFSAVSFAAPTPQSSCRVRINGHESIYSADGGEFFQAVAQASRSEGCTYGKIYGVTGSGRVYVNGRLIGKGLTVAEAKEAKRGMRCTEYSCDEIGILRGNESPSNEIPSFPVNTGDGW